MLVVTKDLFFIHNSPLQHENCINDYIQDIELLDMDDVDEFLDNLNNERLNTHLGLEESKFTKKD